MNLMIAFFPGIFWGILPILVVLIGGTERKQILGVSFGALLAAVFINLLNIYNYNVTTIAVGIFTGICWSEGFFYQLKAIKKIGVSKTSPLSNGSQLLVSTIFSVIVFREWISAFQIILGISAIILISLGMKISCYNEVKEKYSKTDYKEAINYIIISTLAFFIYIVGVQLFPTIDKFAVILPQAFGMFLAATFIVGLKNVKKEIDKKIVLFLVPGIFWFIGNISILFSYNNFGVAISFGLAQLNILISTLASIFILKETKTKKEMKVISFGLFILMIGCSLLTIIK